MANETTEIEGLLNGTAEGVRKAFTDLGSASAAAKRAELLQGAIHGHGQRLIGAGDFDAAPRSGISAAEIVEENGPLSYHQWASGELGRVVAAGDEDEAELQDAIERAADAVTMLVAHGGEDAGEEQPAPVEAPPAEPAAAVAEPAAAPYEAAPEPAPVPAAPEPRPEAAAPRAAEPQDERLSPANEAVDEAIESYEALAEAVMAKLPSEQGTQAELHVALIRAATSLTLDARATAARRETLSSIPAAPAQPSQREAGGGRQGGGQQDRRRGQGLDGGRDDGRDGRRDDRRDDRRGRGRDDFRGGRRDDRRDERRDDRRDDRRGGTAEQAGLPGRNAYCNCGCRCFHDFIEGQTGRCPLCECGRTDCGCSGEPGERLMNTDGIWHWVRA